MWFRERLLAGPPEPGKPMGPIHEPFDRDSDHQKSESSNTRPLGERRIFHMGAIHSPTTRKRLIHDHWHLQNNLHQYNIPGTGGERCKLASAEIPSENTRAATRAHLAKRRILHMCEEAIQFTRPIHDHDHRHSQNNLHHSNKQHRKGRERALK